MTLMSFLTVFLYGMIRRNVILMINQLDSHVIIVEKKDKLLDVNK